MGRPKLSEEEKKQRKRESQAKWIAKNPERYREYLAKYRAEHKEEKNDYQKEYRKTPIGRAAQIVGRYRQNDIKYNRGKCTLTAQWVAENIFTKPCHYCGAMGWEIMGCDRVDNSLPHTPDNVVPCCYECNCKRHTKSYEDFVSMFKIKKLWQN